MILGQITTDNINLEYIKRLLLYFAGLQKLRFRVTCENSPTSKVNQFQDIGKNNHT